MQNIDHMLYALGVVVVTCPLLMTCILGLASLAHPRLSEESTARLGHGTIACGLLASIAILVIMLSLGKKHIPIELGDWVVIPGHYHFSVKFVFDRLSVPFAILSF
ncbi:MAG TPA: oxidoreductase, partial [Planctomycetaceae bacterium]